MGTIIAIVLAAAAGYALYVFLVTKASDKIVGGLDDHDKNAR